MGTYSLSREWAGLLVASDFHKWRASKADVIVGENDSPAFISQAKEFCGKLKNNGFTQAILEIIDEKDHFDLVEKLSEKEDVLIQLCNAKMYQIILKCQFWPTNILMYRPN